MEKGVNINAHAGGVPVSKLSPVGVRATQHSWGNYKPLHCQGVTRKGAACRAKVVTDDTLCIGHGRQREVSK